MILKHSLSGNYPYPSYLQLCSSKLIVSLIEIDVKVWKKKEAFYFLPLFL